jgi:hypothetical protein
VPSCRGQAVPDPLARWAGNPRVGRWAWCRVDGRRGRCMPRVFAAPMARAGEAAPRPYRGGAEHPRCGLCLHGWAVRDSPCCRGQAVPDRAAREGRGMTPSPGYGWRSQRGWAPAVRPGLKPRAESPSPLKGAVRRPGARVDRLGAGAGGVSRLQPAWGLSPAVDGRAIVDTAARLICAACRARRVGYAESPRRWRGRARQRLAPTQVGRSIPGVAYACTDGRCVIPRVVGVRRCLTRRPARAGTCGATGCPRCRAEWSRWQLPRQILPRHRRGGRGSASPLHGWGAASPIGDLGAMVRRDRPGPVGVRRCLTRRLRGPGNGTVAGVRMEITAGVGASRPPGAEAPG